MFFLKTSSRWQKLSIVTRIQLSSAVFLTTCVLSISVMTHCKTGLSLCLTCSTKSAGTNTETEYHQIISTKNPVIYNFSTYDCLIQAHMTAWFFMVTAKPSMHSDHKFSFLAELLYAIILPAQWSQTKHALHPSH